MDGMVLLQIFYKDSPIVVCAPTGAGKTVVFELAIIRLLMKTEHTSLGANFKIVYSKSLIL